MGERSLFQAEFSRRDALALLEAANEVGWILKTAFSGDFLDGKIGFGEELEGDSDSAFQQKFL